ncbi:hypothetical protein [Mariniflexile maritimum]|uniref:hypothetical protein n=1 Tax=Mariniflexile maritimum TaxID=2682493 RepID=UPI0012F6CD6E|nr:hypothetical protein [Mariniflexile maritimum]
MKTKKLKSYLKSVIILSCILLITYNCEKDNYEVNPENSEPLQIEHLFNQSDFSNLIPYEYTVDLDNPKKLYSDELKSSYYEFSVNFTSTFNPNQLNKVQQKGGYYTKYKVMATVNDTGESNFYTIKFYQNVDTTNDSLINSEVSFSNSENFTGIVHLLDRNKKLVFSKKLNKGNLIDIMPFKTKRSSNSSLASREEPNCETIAIPTYTDWYKVYTMDHTTYIEYTHTQFTGYVYEEVCISNGGSLPEVNPYGYNNEGIYTKKTSGGVYEDDADVILIENEVEDKIDATGLTGKADCVYNKMVDSKNNINWILENFKDGDRPSQFNLIFQMSSTLSDSTNASTATPLNSGIPNTFIININSNTIGDRTALGLARTIIHEGIHARLWEFVYRNEGKVSKEDFPGIYDFFRYKKNWDHQQMAAFYRATIAEGLKQFDNARHSDQFYNDMAWEGLANIPDHNSTNEHDQIYTDAWNKLSADEQNRIIQTINDYKANGSKTCD